MVFLSVRLAARHGGTLSMTSAGILQHSAAQKLCPQYSVFRSVRKCHHQGITPMTKGCDASVVIVPPH